MTWLPCRVLAHRHVEILWLTEILKKEILLLEHMINLWDVAEQGFWIGAKLLTIELEDVYFLTGLSKRGVPISFFG
jgi:hypothetical protein